ncbi:PhzF family phenazine biosynthesis protein [Thiomonas sp. FB-Cd]|uniref:PhzF family phenazine biosynthesis protein n=1 Tax=Thiomonas sp. FB-Cd TaxID=1158292 RepID=UPI0004DF9180|nr:PhzF family phenazine biosynthesis protein [Thiomonas sp. FB-Cd]
MRLPFAQLDVFAPEPFSGNPLAVVFDADSLPASRMQAIAAWLGLSETTFVLQPLQSSADYRLRIFTPGGELPFAGHPTLGTCAAWLLAGGKPKQPDMVMQESGVGLVAVRRLETAAHRTQRLAFAAPNVTIGAVEPDLLHAICAALGLSLQQVRASAWLDNGPRWLALWLDSASTVLALDPDHATLKALGVKVGVCGPHLEGHEAAIEVRAFAAATGVPEDPVTGSLNASLAQWLIGLRALPTCYTAAQGTRLARTGRVAIEQDTQGQVWIGGQVQEVMRGEIAV